MSNEVKISQEFYNRLLDSLDKVETLEKSLKETRTVLRTTQLKVKDLEEKILKYNTNVNFNDIFNQGTVFDRKE